MNGQHMIGPIVVRSVREGCEIRHNIMPRNHYEFYANCAQQANCYSLVEPFQNSARDKELEIN